MSTKVVEFREITLKGILSKRKDTLTGLSKTKGKLQNPIGALFRKYDTEKF